MQRTFSLVVVVSSLLAAACGGMYLGLPEANPQNGYGIVGFVGKGPQQAAPSETVTLTNEATGETVGTVTTDWSGKYKFYPLQPGSYVLTVGKISRPVVITDNHQRVDIDLSAKDGTMNYAAAGASGGGQAAVAQGPNDPQLQQQLAGYYWGYSGVAGGSSGGGGTERKKTLCANGNYFDMSESSYYGSTHDQYGDETMNWGATGNNRSGVAKWTVTGTLQAGTITISYPGGKTRTMQYQAGPEPGVYVFDGATLSRVNDGSDQCR